MRAAVSGTLVTTLLLLIVHATTVRCQFKIIGLLETDVAAPEHPLDTNSPLVRIDAIATSGADESRAFRSEDSDELVQMQLQNLHESNETAANSATPPETSAAENDTNPVIKVRIMDEAPPLIQPDNFVDPLKPPTAAIPTETTSIVVLMDKQSRVYAKSYKPKIRKFAYAEERSFHKAGNNHLSGGNDVAEGHRRHEQKLKKITRYRNSFKSRCRCERIANCPRIQITIHRCEQDYFMCCF